MKVVEKVDSMDDKLKSEINVINYHRFVFPVFIIGIFTKLYSISVRKEISVGV